VLAAAKILGGVTEWTVRLPAALGDVGFVLAMYFFGRDFFNARVGAIAAIVLATSFRVMWESRWAHVDMVFGFFPLTCALLWRAGAFAPRRAQGNLARIKGSSLNLYFNRRDLRREPLV